MEDITEVDWIKSIPVLIGIASDSVSFVNIIRAQNIILHS